MSLQDTLKNYGGSVSAASRYVGAMGAGAVIFAGVAGMKPEDMKALIESIATAGNALAGLLTALGTVAGVVIGLYGAWKASKAQQVKTVGKTEGVEVHVDAATAPTQVVAVAVDPNAAGVNLAPNNPIVPKGVS